MNAPDFSDLRGIVSDAINACERAIIEGAPGVLLTGPAGMGATMVARRLTSIFPAPTGHESRWISATYEGEFPGADYFPTRSAQNPRQGFHLPHGRPFRAPHYTISSSTLVVEARLARCGVLLLDELPEFRPDTIRALAPHLYTATHAPLVIATALACPCGALGSDRACNCSLKIKTAYDVRITKACNALRIGIKARVPYMGVKEMRNSERGESSAEIRARIERAL